MLLLNIWIVIFIILLLVNKANTILYLPSIILIHKISLQFVQINPGGNRAIVLLEYSLLFFIILLAIRDLIISRKLFSSPFQKIIFVFVIILLVCSQFYTYDSWTSLKRSFPIFASLITLAALIDRSDINHKSLKIAIKQSQLVLLLFCLNTILLTFLSVGKSLSISGSDTPVYSLIPLHMGQITFYELHGFAILASSFLVFRRLFWMKYYLIINLTAMLIIVTTLKRTYVSIIVFGFIFFYLTSFYLNKQRINKAVLSLFALLVVSYFSFDLLNSVFTFRNKEMMLGAAYQEGRSIEFQLYPVVVREQNDPFQFMLFGKDLFISERFKALNYYLYGRSGKTRFLHSDFAHLLYGAGLIGLFFYIYIIFYSWRRGKYYYQQNKSPLNLIVYQGVLILAFVLIISGLGDGILQVINRLPAFYLLGLFISYLKNNSLPSKIRI